MRRRRTSAPICAICSGGLQDRGAARQLSDATLKGYAYRLEARLDKIMARTPTHQAGVKLKEMIKRTRRHLFVFMTVRELPATNNGSEPAIRPAVRSSAR